VVAVVAREVEQVDCRLGQPARRRFEVSVRSGQGEDGTVVVGISVEVEQQVSTGGGNGRQDLAVASLADVGDALEQCAAPR
jgi:hypothetical protein